MENLIEKITRLFIKESVGFNETDIRILRLTEDELFSNLKQVSNEYNLPVEVIVKMMIGYHKTYSKKFHINMLYNYGYVVEIIKRRSINWKNSLNKKLSKSYTQRTDIEKINHKLWVSSKKVKEAHINDDCTLEEHVWLLEMDAYISDWFKAAHLPWIQVNGYPSIKHQEMMLNFKLGKQVNKLYEYYMKPFGRMYWIRKFNKQESI